MHSEGRLRGYILSPSGPRWKGIHCCHCCCCGCMMSKQTLCLCGALGNAAKRSAEPDMYWHCLQVGLSHWQRVCCQAPTHDHATEPAAGVAHCCCDVSTEQLHCQH